MGESALRRRVMQIALLNPSATCRTCARRSYPNLGGNHCGGRPARGEQTAKKNTSVGHMARGEKKAAPSVLRRLRSCGVAAQLVSSTVLFRCDIICAGGV